MSGVPSLLNAAVVLAVLAGAAHAAPPAKHELVIVADGPSYAVVTMPANISLDFTKSTLTGNTPYVMVVGNQGTKVSTAVTRVPKRDVWFGDATLPKGRSVLRVLTVGKTTIRVPVFGMSGSRTVRLTKRLTDATAVVRDVPVVNETVTDDIPFQTRSVAVVVHGLSRRHDVPLAGVHSFCTAPAGTACAPPITTGSPGVSKVHDWPHKSSHAYVNHTGVGIGQLPVQHYLFAVPVS